MSILIVASGIKRAAGIVPSKLAEVLESAEQRCAILTLYDPAHSPGVVSLLRTDPRKVTSRIVRWSKFLSNGFIRKPPLGNMYRYRDYFSMVPMVSRTRIRNILPFKPRHIVVTFNESLLTYGDLAWLSQTYDSTVHFYCMDMALLSGGCHFCFSCEGYTEDCRSCPAVSSRYRNLPHQILKYKQGMLSQMKSTGIAISSPYEKRLRRSTLFREGPVYKVMHGLDTVVWNGRDRLNARRKFGIPQDAYCVLVCAAKLGMDFKGIQHVVDSLKLFLRSQNEPTETCLLAVGSTSGMKEMLADYPVRVIETGFLEHEEMNSPYFAADLFLSGSYEEPGPRTLEEAMMHSVPAVAFADGVAVDLISEKKSGYLVPKVGDVEAFASSISAYFGLSQKARERMRVAAAQAALRCCSLERHRNSFLEIFKAHSD